MEWPLDVFFSALEDIAAMRIAEAGEKDGKGKLRKVKRDAAYRRKWGQSGPWWTT